jgi:hypothetical protein
VLPSRIAGDSIAIRDLGATRSHLHFSRELAAASV